MFQGGIDSQLNQQTLDILSESKSCLCTIDARIYSDENSDINFTPVRVLSINLIQNFEQGYGDIITAQMEFWAEEAILILSNYLDLKCTLTYNRVENHYLTLLEDIPPQIDEYKVIIANATDLLKAFSKPELTVSDAPGEKSQEGSQSSEYVRSRRIPLEFQLIDADVYEKRERPINAILSEATLQDGIHYVANLLEIKNVKIINVDNNRVFKNLTIPPMQTLGTAFDSWQNQAGVFTKGINAYYTKDILYVYPAFDTDPKTEALVHFYKVPKGSLEGSSSYHTKVSDDEVYIVLKDDVVIENLSEKMTENVGNYHVALRTDSVYDVDKVMHGREGEIRNNNLISVGAQNEKIAISGKVNARYLPVTENAYKMSSAMSACMCKIMTAIWLYAWPYDLTPGMKVLYHYEDVNGYKTDTGILSSLTYQLQPVSQQANRIIYAWMCRVVARLTVDTEEGYKVDSSILVNAKKYF